MSDVVSLTEFYKKEGFSGKDAIEKAEKQIERERERALEIRKMEHAEKMKGIKALSTISFHFLKF
jgi:hypothetical protein